MKDIKTTSVTHVVSYLLQQVALKNTLKEFIFEFTKCIIVTKKLHGNCKINFMTKISQMQVRCDICARNIITITFTLKIQKMKIRFLKSMENKYANAISFFIFSKTFAKHTFLRRKREILSAAS